MHACLSVCGRVEEDMYRGQSRVLRAPGAGVTAACEVELQVQCACWKLNLGPLKKQKALLTTKPPLQQIIKPMVGIMGSLPHNNLQASQK